MRSRLLSVLSVREHESDALRGIDDVRVRGALRAMQQTKAGIVAAAAAIVPEPTRATSRRRWRWLSAALPCSLIEPSWDACLRQPRL
jgi:hypothetical protein